ncbi:MAG: hypothetical protein FWF38_01900 [Spirochaetaceae bacterium]|nr:hypothetical protein [Spirochaetaceae bacterium]
MQKFYKVFGIAVITTILLFMAASCGDAGGGGGSGNTNGGGDPVLYGVIKINGEAEVGETLEAQIFVIDGTGSPISPGTPIYQWKRIEGETVTDIGTGGGPTYELSEDDIGAVIIVTVRYAGYSGILTSFPTNVVTDPSLDPFSANVTIDGIAKVGEILTANVSGESGTSGNRIYQWKRGDSAGAVDTNIPSANGDTYVLAASDFGKYFTVTISYTGNSGEKVSAPKGPVTADLIGTVTITQVSQTLTANTNALVLVSGENSESFSYQWKRGGTSENVNTNIDDATGNTYVLTTADIDQYITVTVGRTGYSVDSSITSPPLFIAIANLPEFSATVTIDGTAKVGETLTANVSAESGTSGTRIYQWKWCDSAVGVYANIPGANGETYLVEGSYFEKYITVTISYSLNSGEKVSAAKGPVTADLTGTVTIDGTAQVDQTLSANIDGLILYESSKSFSYQWKRYENETNATQDKDGTIIGTSATYTLVTADIDRYITVTVSRSGYIGSITSAPPRLIANLPEFSATVTIDGTAKVGETLTANVSAVSDALGTRNYQWKWGSSAGAVNTNIPGANGETYVLQDSDFKKYFTVTITYTGNSNSKVSAPKGPVKADLTGTVTISGTPRVGYTLTANISALVLVPGENSESFSYQWKRGESTAAINEDIGTNATYTLVTADKDQYIAVTVSRSSYDNSITSAPTLPIEPPEFSATVTIDGTAKVGETLTANVSGESGTSGTRNYQWQRGDSAVAVDTNIPGANGATYVLQDSDFKKYFTVTITYTGNSGSKVSAPKGPVTADLTGTVTIDGTAQVDQTLTAITSALVLVPGESSESFSYQWKRGNSAGAVDTTITEANGVTYALTSADLHKYITVTVGRSGYGNSITSAPTSYIEGPTLIGTVTINGYAMVGKTLSAIVAGSNGAGTPAYEWKRSGGTKIGTDSTSYGIQSGDIGSTITVSVSYSDNYGSITSAPTASVITPGNGTMGDPFKVYNIETLQKVGSNTDGWTLSAYYKQIADIDLNSISNWDPIGTSGTPFTGNYDGNNKTISNLKINSPGYDDQGLFGFTDVSAVLKNIVLNNINITGKDNIGGVVGRNSGKVQNSSVSGTVKGNNEIGGIAGVNRLGDSIIEDCYFISGTITSTGDWDAGGIAGSNSGGLIQRCHVTGNVNAVDGAGGVTGVQNRGAVMRECSFTDGTVTVNSGSGTAGGLVAWNGSGATSDYTPGIIENCYASGNVSGNIVGGIAGRNQNNGSIIENSYYAGGTLEGNTVGGIAGRNRMNGLIRNCYSITGILDGGVVGGIVGSNYYYTEGSESGGGIVENCYSTINITGGTVGGVVGINSASTVQNCYSTINITGGTVGGVVGINFDDGIVQNCYSTGDINGSYGNVGGVAGNNSASTVQNCVALNPGVTGGVGRIGYSDVTATLSSNYARSDMEVNGSTITSSDADSENGKDITSTEYYTTSWWTTSGNWKTTGGASAWSTTIWNITNGKLPTLKNVGGTQNPTP